MCNYLFVIVSLKGSDPQCYSVNTEGGRPCTLDQSSLNSLNVILKETAESCDVHALVQVM